MTQAVDSAGGTITEAYDNLDRLTSETTPQGCRFPTDMTWQVAAPA